MGAKPDGRALCVFAVCVVGAPFLAHGGSSKVARRPCAERDDGTTVGDALLVLPFGFSAGAGLAFTDGGDLFGLSGAGGDGERG